MPAPRRREMRRDGSKLVVSKRLKIPCERRVPVTGQDVIPHQAGESNRPIVTGLWLHAPHEGDDCGERDN
jgi:hypothetical protein